MSCSERASHFALGKEVVAYCPSCGDEVPGVPYTMQTLDRAPSQLYVRTSAEEFRNLALMVDCETGPAGHATIYVVPHTPATLRVEIDHGGLVITPDPVAHTPAMPVTPAREVPWAVVVLPAVVLGFVLFRRRASMRPRAIDLR